VDGRILEDQENFGARATALLCDRGKIMTTDRFTQEQFQHQFFAFNFNGLTVKQLKDFVADLPETDQNGDDFTVWIETGRELSSEAKAVRMLNKNDYGCDILIALSV
jgi:hypothetical protein